MGNALSPKPVWPDEIFVVDCPRETLFERLVSPDSVADWLGEELEYIEAVRDGDVAPGLLFKVKTEDAIAHIEVLRLVFDDGGIGEKLRWKFSWISHGPPLHSGVAPPTYEPPSLLQASPALKPAHVWLKENATMSYTTQWTLSDAPNAPGTRARSHSRVGSAASTAHLLHPPQSHAQQARPRS